MLASGFLASLADRMEVFQTFAGDYMRIKPLILATCGTLLGGPVRNARTSRLSAGFLRLVTGWTAVIDPEMRVRWETRVLPIEDRKHKSPLLVEILCRTDRRSTLTLMDVWG